MIKFNSKNQIFTLSNDFFTYSFYVNPIGQLVKLYFGTPIKELTKEDIDRTTYLSGDHYAYYDLKNNKEMDFGDPYISGLFQQAEIPSFMSADKRSPLIKIQHEDGSNVTDFRYVSHEIIKGEIKLNGLPYVRVNKEAETLVVTLKDIKDEIYLKAYYTILEDKSVLVRHNEIINNSDNTVLLNKAATLCLDLPSKDYKVLYVHGAYASDRLLEEEEVKHNTILIDENAGAKGFEHNPVAMIKKNGSTESTGEVIGLGLLYSSNFTISVQGTQMDQTRVVVGINEETFSWKLNKGDSFETPEAFLTYSNEGTDKVTHTFHDLIRENILRPNPFKKEKTILLNSWEGTYFDFNTDKLISYIDKATSMGVNLLVLDDGWFGKRDNDFCSLGDWVVNKNKVDLAKVINHAHSKGMKFGLWVEPEMISYDSDLYRAHPEYALFDRSINPTLLRHQFVLDLTNPEVIDYVDKKIAAIFEEYPIDYVKWDFNRMLTEAVSPYLPKDQQGEVYHRFVKGSYELFDRFGKRFPNILIESCSGGGGRFDLGMLFYSSQIWASDETDVYPRTYIQYATNMFYPLEVIGAHVSARKQCSIGEKAALAMFGTYGYELNPNNLSEDNIKEIQAANERFLKSKDLIDDGDYYPLKNPFVETNLVSWSVVSKDKSKAIIYFFNYCLENWKSRFVLLRGLDAKKMYKCSLDNKVHSGEYYLTTGLNLCEAMGDFTAQLIWLEEVNG